MNQNQIVQYKLDLAKAWIENGQTDLAKKIVRSIIEEGTDANL